MSAGRLHSCTVTILLNRRFINGNFQGLKGFENLLGLITPSKILKPWIMFSPQTINGCFRNSFVHLNADKFMRITKSKIFITLSVLLFFAIAVIIIADRAILNSSKNKLYSEIESIPYNKVGLLLGTGKFLANGVINPYYTYRIDAAAKLIRAGKIKYLIISGDNSRSNYNEPQQMQNDLYAQGIDTSIIYLDYAGFRTFDSMIRLKEIFGQTEVTVISQPFHNQRAIYIAEKEGISAIGYNCQDVSKNFGFKIQVREKFARVKVFLDFLFGKKPKFLGKKIYIP